MLSSLHQATVAGVPRSIAIASAAMNMRRSMQRARPPHDCIKQEDDVGEGLPCAAAGGCLLGGYNRRIARRLDRVRRDRRVGCEAKISDLSVALRRARHDRDSAGSNDRFQLNFPEHRRGDVDRPDMPAREGQQLHIGSAEIDQDVCIENEKNRLQAHTTQEFARSLISSRSRSRMSAALDRLMRSRSSAIRTRR
jgi:hypothetical protein